MDVRRRHLASCSKAKVQGSYTLDLGGWREAQYAVNPNSSLYDGAYESYSNYNVGSGVATMTIHINNFNTFTIYIRSYAESNFDYVMVGQLDKAITGNTSYSSADVKAHTRGNQQSSQEITAYTKVEFTNIGGGEHSITIVYRKDGSVDNGDDRGYLLISKDNESGEGGGSSDVTTIEPVLWFDGKDMGTTSGKLKNKGTYSQDFTILGSVTKSTNYVTVSNNISSSQVQQGFYIDTSSSLPNPITGNKVSIIVAIDTQWSLDLNGGDSIFLIGMSNLTTSSTALTGRWRFGLYNQTNKYLDLWCNDGNSSYSNFCTTSVKPSTGKQILGVTKDSSGNCKFYIDGELVATGKHNKSYASQALVSLLFFNQGIGTTANNGFTGDVYCAKVYNEVLDESQMKAESTSISNEYSFSTSGGTNIITFFIDGVSYQAESGMTWGDWVDSSYNTIGAIIRMNVVCVGITKITSGNIDADFRDQIVAGMAYIKVIDDTDNTGGRV